MYLSLSFNNHHLLANLASSVPSLSPNYFTANLRHHITSSINLSVCISNTGGLKKIIAVLSLSYQTQFLNVIKYLITVLIFPIAYT